jgi:hypothetical protein
MFATVESYNCLLMVGMMQWLTSNSQFVVISIIGKLTQVIADKDNVFNWK